MADEVVVDCHVGLLVRIDRLEFGERSESRLK